MTQLAKWAIRFYSPFDVDDESLTFVGSFDNADGRYHDDIVVFSGMYGVPDFMLWYFHQDMESYNFSKYSLDLRLYLTGDKDEVYHQDQYRVVTVYDDYNSSRKVLFAVQEEYALLRTAVFMSRTYSLPYDENRDAQKLLYEVLVNTGLLPVIFMEHFDEDKKSTKFEYPNFAFEPDWTVYDFIDYVTNENALEWSVKNGSLYVGPELWTYEELNATDMIDGNEVVKIVRTPHTVKIYSHGMPLDVLYYYQLREGQNMTELRCVWVRHEVGANGDKTIGCFVPIGEKITRDVFVDSLEGDKEISEAYARFSHKKLFKQIKVGAIVHNFEDDEEDKYDQKYIEQITYEKDINQIAKKIPRRRVLNVTDPSYVLSKIGRTSPYLGSGEGIQYPVPDTPANFIMLMPDDRIENTVQGPYVFGDGNEGFVIPIKNPKDFRLKTPKGEIYFDDENANWIIESEHGIVYKQKITEPTETPTDTGLTNVNHMYFKSGDFMIQTDVSRMYLLSGGCFYVDPRHEPDGNGIGKYQIIANNDVGQINFYADNAIKIKTREDNASIDIEISDGAGGLKIGTITINTAGVVNIGEGATMVNLAGGNNFLALDTHTHKVPVGPAIPGPPSQAIPTGGITTKTKAT